MVSDNPSGADNQQERPGFEQWVVGFVDGEGCFSVPIFRNRTCRMGWQVQPEFSVVQSARSVEVLYLLKEFFGCGSVVRNGRHDDHRSDLYRYGVKSWDGLVNHIVPFFIERPLRTAKGEDFAKFCEVLQLMQGGRHRRPEGLRQIAAIVETMNRRQRSRFLESSEAIRQLPQFDD